MAALAVLVAHRHPGVGDDAVGVLRRRHRDRGRRRSRRRICLAQASSGFVRRELRRRRDVEAEGEALGGMHPGRQHVVGVAGPGDGAAVDRAAMLLEGHHVGHHLAGMREAGQAVDHRHGGVAAPARRTHVVVEDADHDRIDIARQHARGVGDGLAAAELHLGAGQHDGLAAELAHGDVERDARARRGLVEDHRQRLAGERRSAAARATLRRAFMARLGSSIPRSSAAGMSVRSRKWRTSAHFAAPAPSASRPLRLRAAWQARSMHGHRLADLGLADDQRRQQAHDVVAGRHGQQVLGRAARRRSRGSAPCARRPSSRPSPRTSAITAG